MLTLVVKKIKEVQRNVIVVNIDFLHSDFQIAIDQAKKKSQFTMDAGQDGVDRDAILKYNRQLMGIIAEIACKKYLERVLEKNEVLDWEVIRYDDVRTDGFRSPNNEYDIKISNGEVEYFIESRSSITHDREFYIGLKQFDIIGPYTSVAKSNEDYNDIYLRPLYQYIDFKNIQYDAINFEEYLKIGKVKLYLVAGCLKEDMINSEVEKSMNQGKTNYKVVPIKEA